MKLIQKKCSYILATIILSAAHCLGMEAPPIDPVVLNFDLDSAVPLAAGSDASGCITPPVSASALCAAPRASSRSQNKRPTAAKAVTQNAHSINPFSLDTQQKSDAEQPFQFTFSFDAVFLQQQAKQLAQERRAEELSEAAVQQAILDLKKEAEIEQLMQKMRAESAKADEKRKMKTLMNMR